MRGRTKRAVEACSVEISPKVEQSESSKNDPTWMSSGCTFARRIASQAQKGHQTCRRYSVVGNALTVEICSVALQVLSQAWSSRGPSILFLYLLFLRSKAHVLSGHPLRKTAPICIALYNSGFWYIQHAANRSRARAQLEFHILSQCGVLLLLSPGGYRLVVMCSRDTSSTG